jgi:hypothetical protein
MTDELPNDIPDEDSDVGDIVVYARKVAKIMIDTIAVKKSEDRETANARARDARTLNELVRTLERLDALETMHKRRGGKTKWKEDSELKQALVRRLDKLLESTRAPAGSGEPKRKGSGGSSA